MRNSLEQGAWVVPDNMSLIILLALEGVSTSLLFVRPCSSARNELIHALERCRSMSRFAGLAMALSLSLMPLAELC